MLKKNHIPISLAGATALTAVISPQLFSNPLVYALPLSASVMGAMFGAVLPDFDEFGSISIPIGRRKKIRIPFDIPKFVPMLMKWFLKLFATKEQKRVIDSAGVGHRTFTHSIYWILLSLIITILWGVFFGFDGIIFYYSFGVMAGQIFHFLADMTTYSGIPLLWPMNRDCFHILPKILRLRTGESWIKEPLYTFVFVLVSFIIGVISTGNIMLFKGIV